MIVLDSSAGVEFVARRGVKGDWVGGVLRQEQEIHAPHLVDLEVVSALRRLARRRELPSAGARDALRDFESLPIVRYPAAPFIDRIWALRHAMTPYDAVYVALAEALDAPLLTIDGRLASSGGHRAEIVSYR